MAFEKIAEAFTHSAPAGADLSAKLHYFAAIDGDGNIVLASDGGPIAGVLHEVDIQGNPVSIYFGAIGKVVTAEQINAGAILASDGNGKAVAAAAGDWVAGIALEDADSGAVVPFIFASGRRHA